MEQELITLGILFVFALIGGILSARFKQPMLMGLLLVGALIGPHAFGLIHNEHLMEAMIEFGAILILFILGLEFDISKLKKIGLKAIIIAFLNSAILTFVGFSIALLLGFNVTAALFLGVILAFGSTVVIVKVLENKGLMDRQEVPLLIAILIIEDIIAVIIITFFSGVQDKTKGLIGNIESLIISMCILIISYILFIKFVKPLLEYILKKNNSEEIITFTALAMCAGYAYFSYYLHLSPAVGAFLAGSIIASLPNAKGFEHAISPYNIIISSFFFIAIGTMINIKSIIANIMIILVFVLVVIITKLTAFSGMVYFFANMKGDKMFFSSIAMFSVGEFSLLVAKESTKFNIGVDLISIAAAIIAISAVIMSFTINYSNKIYEPAIEKMPWKFRKALDKIAEYIKSITEELDLENKYNRSLKNMLGKIIITTIGILLILFGYRRFEKYVLLNEIFIDPKINALIYIATIVLIASLIFYLTILAKKTLNILSEVFDNATSTKSIYHSKKIIRKATIAISSFSIALTWPFVMFLLNTKPAYIIISYILIIIAIINFYNISKLMHDNNSKERLNNIIRYDNFKSESHSAKEFNRGWRI